MHLQVIVNEIEKGSRSLFAHFVMVEVCNCHLSFASSSVIPVMTGGGPSFLLPYHPVRGNQQENFFCALVLLFLAPL